MSSTLLGSVGRLNQVIMTMIRYDGHCAGLHQVALRLLH